MFLSPKINEIDILEHNILEGNHFYFLQLDDIDSDMSLNHCPCYVESLGKKMCLKCERKNSNEFHVPGERSSM